MIAVKISKLNKTLGKENKAVNDLGLAMPKGEVVALSGTHDSYSWMISPFPSHPGIYTADSTVGGPLPSDCHGILEQAALERCHGNNEAYIQGINRLARCSSENKQLSCRKKCREEVLKQADFIADYGMVLEGATSRG